MKKLLAIALAILLCAGLSGCVIEKIETASAPVSKNISVGADVQDPEFSDGEEEVDAQIPEEYLEEDDWGSYDDEGFSNDEYSDDEYYDDEYSDDEYYDDEDYDGEEYHDDFDIPRTLTPAEPGAMIDGQQVDYVIQDDLFVTQIDEIGYYSEDFIGKSFSVIGYVMLPEDPEDKTGFAVVRDYQEPHYDDEAEFMSAEEFAALVGSPDSADADDAAAPDALQTPQPLATGTPLPTSAPELGAAVSVEPEPSADEDAEIGDVLDHEHEIYQVGIDCYYEGAIPQEDAWVRVVGTLEEYEYNDPLTGERYGALRLHVQSVAPLPETEGGPRKVEQ